VTLREKIVQEIRRDGPIPFSRYMELCLYDNELGYYSRNAEQFGKAGDFYTSSDVHALFGRLLARQFEEMWRMLGAPEKIEIIELGPGRGLFAQDVLDWSEKKFPEFFRAIRYCLMEKSPMLRARLKDTLSRHFLSGKATLAEELSGEGPVIVFANEFFDALPIEIVSLQGELRVGEENGRFVELWASPSADAMDLLSRCSVGPEGDERVEVPLAGQRYIKEMGDRVERGFVVIVDYGYARAEQIAGRHRDTVMSYRRHSVSGTPYDAPGEQDITAHVNFTALASIAEQRGMQVQALLTQSQFLMGIGEHNQFADAFEECRLPQERAKVALQLKHLITPAGMGESFHVLVASKGVEIATVEKLGGLSFGKPDRKEWPLSNF
jgi:SAM-dependent MidA family methyltransferase